MPVYCSVCETELGPPEGEINSQDAPKEEFENHVPDGHVNVVWGSKGPRFHCTDHGSMMKIVDENGEQVVKPAEYFNLGNGGSGGSTKQTKNQNRKKQAQKSTQEPDRSNQTRSRGLDLPKERTPKDILGEILSNKLYGLSDEQIQEILSWAEEYEESLIPPDALEQLLKLLEGVQKQTAELMRSKYELKINRWRREQSQPDTGPSLGALRNSGVTSPKQVAQRVNQQGGQSQQTQQQQQQQQQQSQVQDNGSSTSLRGRKRRVQRRQEALDKAVVEAAPEVADAFAQEFSEQFGFSFRLIRKVLMRKAEKDPDWFIEKAEQWDVDILEIILEPSDARQQELAEQDRQQGKPAVDMEIENAAERIQQNNIEQQQHQNEEQSNEITGEEELMELEDTFEEEHEDIEENEQNDEELMFEETLGNLE